MSFVLLSGSANRTLATAVAGELHRSLGDCLLERFPDGELHIEVREGVRSKSVFIIQPTSPPVGENLLELLLISDACWRAGASRVVGVIPYFGYARQDRRTAGVEPLGARLMADLLVAGRMSQIVVVDLHSAAVEGCFGVPVIQLSAIPCLLDRLQSSTSRPAVVVAPDVGAAKLAERYAKALQLPVAIVHKSRLSGSDVVAQGLVGAVRSYAAIVVDDMISTGGTVEAAVQALAQAGCSDDITVVATHALLVGPAIERLTALPIRRLVVTDTVPPPAASTLPMETVSIASLLAQQIREMEAAQRHDGPPLF